MNAADRLLSPGDPPPFEVVEGRAHSPFVLIADHAGRAIPARLGSLGLTSAELDRHIAWDIGIAAVSRRLAARLGAFLILQNYSRLVIDCNRPLSSPTSIATLSEYTTVPGNQNLSAAQARARAAEVFEPYHARIEREFERRERAGESTILVTMHSFTPSFKGGDREWHCGLLYNRDRRLAERLFPLLASEGLNVGDNQPYFVSDETDYAIPKYGEQRGHAHVELEIRQDLITDEPQQEHWAALLERVFRRAAQEFMGDGIARDAAETLQPGSS